MGCFPMPFASERRRHPRAEAHGQLQIALPVLREIDIIDVSRSGMLVSSSDEVPPGTRGHLRVLLGGRPFAAVVVVRRVGGRTSGAPQPYSLGLAFVPLDPQSTQVLEAFLSSSEPHARPSR
jgi:hypothetical protein